MKKPKQIIKRICQVAEVKNQKELANKLDINYQTMAGWISRDAIPLEVISQVVKEYDTSYDYILDGKENTEELTPHIEIHSIKKVNITVSGNVKVTKKSK